VLELLGHRFPMRLCSTCAPIAAERELAAEREQALERALAAAGGTPRLLRLSLATYPRDEQGARVVAFANEWLDAFEAGERRNLWLAGPVGVGKTGLAWAIVRELAERSVRRFYELDEELRGTAPAARVLFVNWRDLLADYRASIGSDAEFPLLERVRRVAVLALDDLGSERPTDFARDALATLVEHRYQRELPTIVTSNYPVAELSARLGHDEPVIGRRIVDRLADGARGLRFEGSSRRSGA
jgi:DNA replication protein DnaC